MKASRDTAAAIAAQSAGESGIGLRAVQAAYFAFVLCIPIETLYLLTNDSKTTEADGVTLTKPLGILLFGLALINSSRCFRKIPAAFWMLAWYLAACAASQLWIPAALDARFIAHQMTMLQMAALFLISFNLFVDAGFREAVLRFYGWWVSLVAAAMLLGMSSVSEARSSIPSQNPNLAAALFALGAVCLAGDPRLLSSRRIHARLAASMVAITVLILAILQTGSRGGLMAFAAGILALGACAGKTTRSKRLLIVGAVLGALVLLVMHEFSHGTEAAARLDAAWNRGDTAGRTAIWRMCWTMFQERPLFGYGAVNNLFTLGIHMNYAFRDTHNFFFAVLTEVGLVGALPLIGAIAHAAWLAWRYGGRTGDGLPFALMAALVTLVLSSTAYHDKIFWVVLAAAVACGVVRGSLPPGKAAAVL